MTALSRTARETIRFWYFGDEPRIQVTIAGYVRRYFGEGGWGGDSCGCVDDRCIGFHHDESDECHCLEAWLDGWVREQQAAIAAEPIWASYRASVAADDPAAYEAAWEAAAGWARTYHGAGLVSLSLDAIVDGQRGISIRTQWNDQDWLVWAAPLADVASS